MGKTYLYRDNLCPIYGNNPDWMYPDAAVEEDVVLCDYDYFDNDVIEYDCAEYVDEDYDDKGKKD